MSPKQLDYASGPSILQKLQDIKSAAFASFRSSSFSEVENCQNQAFSDVFFVLVNYKSTLVVAEFLRRGKYYCNITATIPNIRAEVKSCFEASPAFHIKTRREEDTRRRAKNQNTGRRVEIGRLGATAV